jgi:hypothetical protein
MWLCDPCKNSDCRQLLSFLLQVVYATHLTCTTRQGIYNTLES